MKFTKKQQPYIERWLTALRSDEYSQGQSYLVQPAEEEEGSEYCCLGVLASLNGWLNYTEDMYIQRQNVPPDHPMYDILFQRLDADENHSMFQSSCGNWNDGHSYTFEKIADLIEAGEGHDVPV